MSRAQHDHGGGRRTPPGGGLAIAPLIMARASEGTE